MDFTAKMNNVSSCDTKAQLPGYQVSRVERIFPGLRT
jgi:hypothetical protein